MKDEHQPLTLWKYNLRQHSEKVLGRKEVVHQLYTARAGFTRCVVYEILQGPTLRKHPMHSLCSVVTILKLYKF